jgi:hypothetical protein
VRQCACINNLRSINGGLQQFWIDHNEWPQRVSTNNGGTKGLTNAWQHYQIFSNYLQSTTWLTCPTDIRNPAKDWHTLANSNISYFIVAEFGSDQSVLWAGDRNFTRKSNTIISLDSEEKFQWETNIGIHQGFDFGVVLLDSAPIQVNSRELSKIIKKATRTNSITVIVP